MPASSARCVPNTLGHLLVASIVATPVAIVVAALLVPPRLTDASAVAFERQDANTMVAITRGTLEGLQLLLNIVAMLVVFIALVALVNGVLGALPAVNGAPLTLERLFGSLFTPLASLIEHSGGAGPRPRASCSARDHRWTSSSPTSPWRRCGPASVAALHAADDLRAPASPTSAASASHAQQPRRRCEERRRRLATLSVKIVFAGLLSTCIAREPSSACWRDTPCCPGRRVFISPPLGRHPTPARPALAGTLRAACAGSSPSR